MTTQTAKHDPEAALRIALWSVVLVGVTAAILGAIFAGARHMVSVALGAGIAALNLWTIGLVVRGQMGKLRLQIPWGVVGVIKFILLFAAVYGLIKSGWVHPLSLLIGYGALPLGIVAAQLSPPPRRADTSSTRIEHGEARAPERQDR